MKFLGQGFQVEQTDRTNYITMPHLWVVIWQSYFRCLRFHSFIHFI